MMTSASASVLKLRDVDVLATYDRQVTGEPKAGLPRCRAPGTASTILTI